MNRYLGLRIVAGFGALFFFVFGIWPLVDPEGFFEDVADFPPYNEHFLHDVGAFQVGLGVSLVLALIFPRDALLVALIGGGTGALIHAGAHITDSDQGGSDSDTIVLFAFAILLLTAGAIRLVTQRSAAAADSR